MSIHIPHPWRDARQAMDFISDKDKSLQSTEALAGHFSTRLTPYVDLMGSVSLNTTFRTSKLTDYIKYYVSKFSYVGDTDKLDTIKLEEYLFRFGRVCIVKFADKFFIGDYVVKTYNLNFDPETIHFVPAGERIKELKKGAVRNTLKDPKDKRKNKVFTVGVDCVIIQNGPAITPTAKTESFSGFVKLQDYLKDLEQIYTAILVNIKTARSVLVLPGEISNEILDKIKKAVLSNSPIIPIGDNQSDILSTALEKSLLDFKDRTNELIDNYNFMEEQIKTFLGCDTNSNNKKRERQTPTEIVVQNDYAMGINETERLYRTRGMEDLKKVFNLSISVLLYKDRKKDRELAFEASLQNPIENEENEKNDV